MKKTILTALATIAIAFSCNAQVSTVDTSITKSVVIIDNNKTKHLPSFYLKRGSNLQLSGIIVTAAGGLIGAGIISLTTSSSYSSSSQSNGSLSPQIGIGVISVSTLVGTILYISGINDYGMAGRALKYSGQ